MCRHGWRPHSCRWRAVAAHRHSRVGAGPGPSPGLGEDQAGEAVGRGTRVDARREVRPVLRRAQGRCQGGGRVVARSPSTTSGAATAAAATAAAALLALQRLTQLAEARQAAVGMRTSQARRRGRGARRRDCEARAGGRGRRRRGQRGQERTLRRTAAAVRRAAAVRWWLHQREGEQGPRRGCSGRGRHGLGHATAAALAAAGRARVVDQVARQ